MNVEPSTAAGESPFDAPYIFNELETFTNKGVHLGICGSIAAFRAPDLVRWWQKSGIRVSATLTESATRFISPLTFEALGALPIYTDMWEKDATFGHLEPGQCAHAMVIAPATASTIAQLAGGAAHTMLACQALAFAGPLILAPSMNPHMWQHAATQENIEKLRQRGVQIIAPGLGNTACGDKGQGRLADLRHIWLASLKALCPQDMQGTNVLVTLGPTREQWDAVRYWSNPSTGAMGACLALCAWLRGANVHAICGPIHKERAYLPHDCKHMHIYDVNSADQMYTAAHDLWARMDMGIFTAAVADYRPQFLGDAKQEKFKKSAAQEGLDIHFLPNKDILRSLAHNKNNAQKILGFAAESVEDLAQAVRTKLARKGAHIIAGNNITAHGCGFGTTTNSMVVADIHGREEQWPLMPKVVVAWRLCSWLLEI